VRFDTVCLLTDLGTDDETVGVVKAILHDLAPGVRVLDLTHGVAPFDVRGGSLALARAIPYVPAGIVIAVVDPGAGTQRRALAIEVAGGAGVLLGPDNGLLAPAVALAGGAERAVALTDPRYHLAAPGATLAVRDVFAPVAAHLCNGVELDQLGDAVDPDLLVPGVIPLPRVEPTDRGAALVAEVLWIDRFGNCQLNVGPEDLRTAFGDEAPERLRLTLGEAVRSAALVEGFDAIGHGALGLLVDASGMLTLAVSRGSAAAEVPLGVGDQVVLEPDRGDDLPATPVRLRIER
jgi:S-adenosylmethionine hydrolase